MIWAVGADQRIQAFFEQVMALPLSYSVDHPALAETQRNSPSFCSPLVCAFPPSLVTLVLSFIPMIHLSVARLPHHFNRWSVGRATPLSAIQPYRAYRDRLPPDCLLCCLQILIFTRSSPAHPDFDPIVARPP
eukprot:3286241-Rhodomonas_salina.1